MELKGRKPDLEFQWHDIKFMVRQEATREDRFELNILYDVDKKGKVEVPRGQIYKTLITRFVTGWHGVTEDGNAVPFSLEAMARLPLNGDNEDVYLLLGAFIVKHTGIFTVNEERKNG